VTLNGVPVTAFGDDISRYIGVIPQQPYVFNATLLNNLRIGRMDASEAEVWDALHKVGLTDLANRLPEGLHTIVDEAGLRFSGGERQRLALARVILTDAPIIILDEPTVGLDPLTEQRILESFFHNLASKTIIWITHHLQGIDLMDRVLFIEDGRAVMDDTPQALLQNNDYFRHLYLIDRGEI
jgi:ATP-binding cassette subfamily C protein CydC